MLLEGKIFNSITPCNMVLRIEFEKKDLEELLKFMVKIGIKTKIITYTG